MKKFFLDCGTRDPLASTGLAFLRVTIGWMMLYGHGVAKIQNFEQMKAGWPAPGIFPLNFMNGSISLMATIIAEVVAAGLLILGLATRPAAFVLGFAMVVAAFQVNAHAPFFASGAGPAKEMAVPTSPLRSSEGTRVVPKPGGKRAERVSLKGEFAEGASSCAFPLIAEVQC